MPRYRQVGFDLLGPVVFRQSVRRVFNVIPETGSGNQRFEFREIRGCLQLFHRHSGGSIGHCRSDIRNQTQLCKIILADLGKPLGFGETCFTVISKSTVAFHDRHIAVVERIRFDPVKAGPAVLNDGSFVEA